MRLRLYDRALQRLLPGWSSDDKICPLFYIESIDVFFLQRNPFFDKLTGFAFPVALTYSGDLLRKSYMDDIFYGAILSDVRLRRGIFFYKNHPVQSVFSRANCREAECIHQTVSCIQTALFHAPI